MRIGLNTPWLVKSDGRVVGPYLEKQIADLLREKAIRPIDEVARPCGRWNYLRDEPAFAKIVEEIRIRSLKELDDTTTKGADVSDLTRTDTISQTEPDELTQEITAVPSSQMNAQDVLFHSIEDQKRTVRPAGDTYTHDGDLLVKLRANQATRWVWALTAVVILLTLGFVVFRQFIAIPIQNKAALDHSTTAGIEALESGDYARAADLFGHAHALDPSDRSIYLYLGILQIQVENQAFKGRQLIEQLRNDSSRDLKQILTGIGLGYLKENDSKQAEIAFKKVLDIDPLYQYALINLGAAALYQEEWVKASNHLQLAIKDGSHDGADVLMLAEANLRLFSQSQGKDKEALALAQKVVEDYTDKNFDYKFETKVAQMYLYYLAGEKPKLYPMVDQLLEMDLQLTENHRHSLFVHRDRISWANLSQWCLKATQDLDPNSHVVALEGVCLLKSGEIADANRKIDDALAQTPRDPLVLAIASFVMHESNSNERSAVMLEKSIDADPNGQVLQVLRQKARLCKAKEDRDCVRDVLKKILVREPNSLMALSAHARFMLQDKDLAEAKRIYQLGVQLSENYRPFIALGREIGQSEDREKARGL